MVLLTAVMAADCQTSGSGGTNARTTGDRLDQAVSHDKWLVKAYLVPDRRTLVLVAAGT